MEVLHRVPMGSLSDEERFEDFGFVNILFHQAAVIIQQGWCERRLAFGETVRSWYRRGKLCDCGIAAAGSPSRAE